MDEFTITITGRGGHSAYPHLALDPVPALCQSVLAARDAVNVVDPMRPAVVTVGMLQAGTAPNVIGEVARAHGTLRTIDAGRPGARLLDAAADGRRPAPRPPSAAPAS